MSVNRTDATLTDEQHDRANPTLAAMVDALPFLIDLSAKDRADCPKFGDKNRTYVVKTSPSLRHIPTGFRSVSTSRHSSGLFRSSTHVS
jgi:hypothetical protein